MNITANSDRLVRILLVFGSIPKIPLGNVHHLLPDQRERFKAMESATEKMERIVAAHCLKIAATIRAKPVHAFSVPPGNDILVCRENRRNRKVHSSCTSTKTTRPPT